MKNTLLLTLLIVVSLSNFYCTDMKKPVSNNAIDPQNMDTTVRPGDDFFTYANGKWMEKHPVPDIYSSYGAFTELFEENEIAIKEIIMNASKDKADKTADEQKIGDYYASGMDTVKIEELGFSVIKEELDNIVAMKTKEDVAKMVAFMSRNGYSSLFYIFSGQDQKNTERIIANFYQGGLGLPDQSYYHSDDPMSEGLRAGYLAYIQKLFELTGNSPEAAKEAAKNVMNIETALAKTSNTRLENRDSEKTYNKIDVEELMKISPNFAWKAYFEAVSLPNPGDINVMQPKFIKGMSEIVKNNDVSLWRDYFTFKLLNSCASSMSKDFEEARFDFYGRTLSGTKVMEPRWKKMVNNTSGALGESVGKIYVANYFPPEAKERMVILTSNLKVSLGNRIKNLDWMTSETKEKALEKLAAMNVKVGYPDKWIDYSALEISPNDYMQNIKNASIFAFNLEMAKIGKPVDRLEWGMTPQTVNAYYSPNMNEVVFPAAILQPPFFYLDADDAVNYGAIGVVIGHEMTHGFDDQGCKYDKDGNLNNWWTEEDSKAFVERSQKLVDQFNSFTVFDTLHVDGNLTLGENIADLGGLNISYQAMHTAFGDNVPAPIQGLTADQRFFLSYAQVWRQTIREEALKRRLKEDVHSPGQFRVNGPLFQLEAFYNSFEIDDTDPLFIPKDKRAVVW